MFKLCYKQGCNAMNEQIKRVCFSLLRAELPVWVSLTSLHPAGSLGIRAHVRWTAGPAPTQPPTRYASCYRHHHIETYSMKQRVSLYCVCPKGSLPSWCWAMSAVWGPVCSVGAVDMSGKAAHWGTTLHVRFINSTHTLGWTGSTF